MNGVKSKLREYAKVPRAPGETDEEFLRRMEREQALDSSRYCDPSIGPGGRRLPIRYEQ